MKRETAIKNIRQIVSRLEKCRGIIETKGAGIYDGFMVDRLYVFGSTAKGSQNPNDIDLLISGRGVNGNKNPYGEHSFDVAMKKLRKGMKMVRFHEEYVDGAFGDIAETKIMIWPDCHFEE